MRIFIHDYFADDSRSEGITDQASWVMVIRNDVDFFTIQFIHHGLNARTLHTYAGTDRVDCGITGIDRNFRTIAGITSVAKMKW